MEKQYSFAVCLPKDAEAAIDDVKSALARKIGWFGSRNSKGHITFNLFRVEDTELLSVKEAIRGFCAGLSPFEASFDYFDTFPKSGAFFLAPDSASKEKLSSLMESFHIVFPKIIETIKSHEPHVSIARQLSGEKMESAETLFAGREVSVVILVDRICLREFDPRKKQYFIADEFPFGGVL